jgi:LysM repeat protein
MSQLTISILLVLALVLPVLGALVLRFLASRVRPARLYATAATIFGIAFASVLWLARSPVPSLSFLGVSLLLPMTGPADQELELPLVIAPTPDASVPSSDQQPATTEQVPAVATEIAEPAATTTPSVTDRPTSAPTATSEPPTATLEPTEAPTATPVPPTETPVPATAAPAGPRTYRVQPGDTLRSIAEQFDVSVQALLDANDLTPEEADSLRIDQELVIP